LATDGAASPIETMSAPSSIAARKQRKIVTMGALSSL
jgi:hypothetical protein